MPRVMTTSPKTSWGVIRNDDLVSIGVLLYDLVPWRRGQGLPHHSDAPGNEDHRPRVSERQAPDMIERDKEPEAKENEPDPFSDPLQRGALNDLVDANEHQDEGPVLPEWPDVNEVEVVEEQQHANQQDDDAEDNLRIEAQRFDPFHKKPP